MRKLAFTVLGTPAPKGSSRAMIRGGQAVNVPSGSTPNKLALADWGGAVRAEAVRAIALARGSGWPGGGVFFGDVPLRITIAFRLRRIRAHFLKNGDMRGDAPKWHIKKPDLDKLVRSTKDALTGIIVMDDSLFAESLARKVYAVPGQEGAWIQIEEIA